ncbi:MAG: ribosomal protein S18 acetylase RimI-like enzyme, partial [Paracoccaceae bacterium]
LDEARRPPAWQAALKAPPPQGAVIALAGAGIIGLVSFGAPSHPVFAGRGEVTHLYVDQAMRGRGLGARLLALALGGLHAAGYAGAALAVVTQNPGARAFYRAQGGEEIASFQDPGLLWPSDDILVAWDLRG